MSTLFEPIRQKFFRRIEKDEDFFKKYNITLEEAIELAKEQANGYIIEAVEKLTFQCSPDINFMDYDETLELFNPDLTAKEQSLIVELMREVYFERDLVKLRAFKFVMTPTDYTTHSPANERNSYMAMITTIKSENITKISQYASTDRITGKPKKIDFGKYQDG
jgi:hypothetical protein